MLDKAWCAAVITAAGASSRMGRVKALVELEGRPMLCRQLEALCGFAQRIVVLGADEGAIRQQLAIELEGATVVSNPAWASGRSSSLRAGFAAVSDQARGILVSGVDQPIDPAAVAALMDAFDPAAHSHAVPVVGNRPGHPVLLNAILLAPHLVGLSDDVTLKDVLRPFEATKLAIPVGSDAVLSNLNTSQDVAAFIAGTRPPAPEA